MKSAQPISQSKRGRGFILVASLLFLLIMTIIGLAMYRSFGLHGRMAGNFREKGRAFEAAQAAMQYAEWWLSQSGHATAGTSCTTLVSQPTVCSNALSNPATLPWTVGVNFSPSNLSVASGGLTSFASNPQYYIQYLGTRSDNSGYVYQITAVGYGGNQLAAVVLQSTYLVSGSVVGDGT